MFVYNVTFIHSCWHITTTVEVVEYDNDEDIIEMAADWIMGTSGLELSEYKFVDIDVEYAGEIV